MVKDTLTIFEVGFAIGIGAIRTYEKTKDSTNKLHFISCELDEGLVQWIRDHEAHPLISSLEKTVSNNVSLYQSSLGNFKLTVIIGDIRQTLMSARDEFKFNKFDAIYQDAFSPKKNPTLWTTEWFMDLKSLSLPDCILSTYSAAMPIRKSMLDAGWCVFKREGYGEKRSSTIAMFDKQMNPEFLRNMENSPEQALTDKLLDK